LAEFSTEYRVDELLLPPYFHNGIPRPKILQVNKSNRFNQEKPIEVKYAKIVTFLVSLPKGTTPKFTASIIDHGFVTHSVHMSQRLNFV